MRGLFVKAVSSMNQTKALAFVAIVCLSGF